MPSLYVDPNYDPAATYSQLEALLLLFDTEYVYGPNATAIEGLRSMSGIPPVSPERFLRLVERGYVVPVAGPQYWDQQWRENRSAELHSIDVDRSAFYRWTDFDEAIASHGRRETSFYDAANHASALESHAPQVFAALLRHVSALRSGLKLPEEFYRADSATKSDEDICRKLLYNLGGDLALLGLVGADALIVSENQTSLYDVYDSLTRESPFVPRRTLWRRSEDLPTEVREDDFRIAEELAQRLASRYEILDILDEYRRSNFYRMFRLWVANALPHLREEGYRRMDFVGGLMGAFEQSKGDLQGYGVAGGGMAAGAAFEIFTNHPATERFTASVKRRIILRTGGVLASIFAGASLLPRPIARVAASLTEEHDSWIALFARRAVRRE